MLKTKEYYDGFKIPKKHTRGDDDIKHYYDFVTPVLSCYYVMCDMTLEGVLEYTGAWNHSGNAPWKLLVLGHTYLYGWGEDASFLWDWAKS